VTAWLRRFSAFWYDFLVGDRWELFVGPIAVLAIAGLLTAAGVSGAIAGVLLFAGIVAVGALSVALAVR
jgi:hypothetical protein